MSFITAPLGKSASVVELTMNGHRFDTLRSRVPSGEDIDEWLREYRGVNEAPLLAPTVFRAPKARCR